MIETSKKIIKIPEYITVKDFSDRANLPVTAVISELIKNGVMASINETIDFETAQIVGEFLGLAVEMEEKAEHQAVATTEITGAKKDLKPRPPVVTIMGHVDHGKTTLLDQIRKTTVAAGESGGITQHISAYQVTLDHAKHKELKNKTVTFIDTPGHAAFSAMREHGTAITDIVVLIVAADDGVMPQTIEVIEQAKSNNVPVIVAINKTDLPDADIQKIKQQLSDHELVPEEWGGKTMMAEVSAKTGKGVTDLLEMILLQAEMMELKANPTEKAVGVVIETHMQKGIGPSAVVLIQNGTLHQSDPVAIGSTFGKIRVLHDFLGHSITEAGPATPVMIAGLKCLPDFGERMLAFSSEKEARENSDQIHKIGPELKMATAKKINESDEDKTEVIELRIVLKCDVAGSLEAVRSSLEEIVTPEYRIKIISEGVGPVSEGDVTLAKATKGVVYAFRVQVPGASKRIADKEGIAVKNFQVIYELIDSAKAELADLLPLLIIEDELGRGKVLQIFVDDKKSFVAGGAVDSGRLALGDEIKFIQNETEKYRDRVVSLRKEKGEAKEVNSGTECGFGLSAGAKISVGDIFIAFLTRREKREIK